MTYSAWGTVGLPGAEQTLAMQARAGQRPLKTPGETKKEQPSPWEGQLCSQVPHRPQDSSGEADRPTEHLLAPTMAGHHTPGACRAGWGGMSDTCCADAQGVAPTSVSVTGTLC